MNVAASVVVGRRALCSFSLVIENIGDIVVAYGDGLAGRVLAELCERVERVVGLDRRSVALVTDGLRFSAYPEKAHELLHVAVMPVLVGDVRIVMALGLYSEPELRVVAGGNREAQGIRADMEVAADVYEAALCGRFHLAVQPIVRSSREGASDDILYWECLARLTDGYGHSMSPGVFMPTLERLGLARYFDVHVVSSTLRLLRGSSHVSLGCNISGLSAVDDHWWVPVFATLSNEPALAKRLVIEITETAKITNVEACLHFIDRMRALGCRVALDDFGQGFHSIDFARRCRPDVIKIDRSFVPRDENREDATRLFAQLISLGATLARDVVVEGIEDATDHVTAVDCGARWMQGYHIALPASPAEDVIARGGV